MSFLITGGAGYIGSHVVRALTNSGEKVVVLDDLSTGDVRRIPAGTPVVIGSTLDRELLDRTLREHRITGIVHLAAKKQVAESVALPLHYYRENVHGLTVLLEAAAEAGVRSFLFSSSAAVYGMPDLDVVTEDTPCAPINPYGETKLAGEWLVRAAGAATGMSTACLRYFNVAGAAVPELADTGVFNLVPMVFEKLDAGAPPAVFGDDYPTPDGTCIRDFVHVEDLADAHRVVAQSLAERPERCDLTYNIGRGEGTSVRRMIGDIVSLTGHDGIEPRIEPRRAGDPARVVAAAGRIADELGWTARHDTAAMITSAWAGWRHHRPTDARSAS
ncbi:UDP-glucose 4-epimerase GalE [Streptomyces finlayi]|nr:UDP-glucose 4-epimerase GalE [Streptomyces finlayi]